MEREVHWVVINRHIYDYGYSHRRDKMMNKTKSSYAQEEKASLVAGEKKGKPEVNVTLKISDTIYPFVSQVSSINL
jgi:hypothetical protein